jgi:hypothetical protein
MRKISLAYVAFALLAACGSGGGGGGKLHLDLGTDLSGQQGSPDLRMQQMQPDLAMPACQPPKTDCGDGVCANLATDPNNCGACGMACAGGETCMASRCSGGAMMTGCYGFLVCYNKCAGNDMCIQGCFDNTTPQGQMLLDALLMCLDTACPGNLNGDPCFDPMSQACGDCYMAAQGMGGKCGNEVNACVNNKP